MRQLINKLMEKYEVKKNVGPFIAQALIKLIHFIATSGPRR